MTKDFKTVLHEIYIYIYIDRYSVVMEPWPEWYSKSLV